MKKILIPTSLFVFPWKISSYKLINLKKTIALIITLILVNKSYSQIEFIENKGQWNSKVKFMSSLAKGAFFLEKNGFTVLMNNSEDINRVADKKHQNINHSEKNIQPVIRSHAYKVQFLNSNESPEIIGEKMLPSTNNYFIGDDKTKWASNCRLYKNIIYKNVYPGVDIKYYSDAAGRLKYDFIIHPGANPDIIKLQYQGIDSLGIYKNELLIKTSVGVNKELNPYSYEVNNNEQKTINCKYEINGKTVTFKTGKYAKDKTVIIDPTEVFFTYSGSTADNWGYASAYGSDGSFFSGGVSFNNGYPVTMGAFQTAYQGGERDIVIMKLTPDGSNRIYATYIGGNGVEQPHSMFVDPQGNLIILGRTNSSNYPTTVPLYGPGGGFDIFVTKLNATGTALIGSMRIGGNANDGVNISSDETSGIISLKRNYGEDARSDLLLDKNGNIYIASCSQSNNFKTTTGAFQTVNAGSQDAVVLKLNQACNSVIWSSYLGGTGNDAAYCLALDNNNLYVAGGTSSTNLNGVTPSGVISSFFYGGACDGFIIKMPIDGSTVIKGTYLGTPAADQVYEVQTDKTGNIYVMGTTEGSWPVINAPFVNANSKQFISKLNPDLSSYIYSTVFGSGSTAPNISPTAFFVDRCENVYVSGWGGKPNTLDGYPTSTTTGLPVTPDAIKLSTDPSGSDFYVFVLKKDASLQLYGTFFGQDDPVGSVTFGDHTDGGSARFDSKGTLYQTMCANCFKNITFNGTPGSWSLTNQALTGAKCNQGMLKIAMNFSGVIAAPKASDTLGCITNPISFSDTLHLGNKYVWDFGDGTLQIITTASNITHSYTTVGNYLVRLIAIDSSTCNISDTSYLNIRIQNACPYKVCPGSNINLISVLSGINYQWQVSTDSVNFTNLTNNSNYSGINTNSLQINNPPTAWYGYQYRLMVDGNFSSIFTITFSNTWIGSVSSAWENPANWSCNSLPDTNTDVIINNGSVILNSNSIIRSLLTAPSASITINPGYHLTINH